MRRYFLSSSRQHSKKNDLKPHLKRYWCIGKINSLFIAKMERILSLYRLPYDPDYPVLCFDERPCFLIGNAVAPLPLQSGKPLREHYAYEKNGSCVLLMAIEPLTARRIAGVFEQRTKKEFCSFCQELAAAYPQAIKIRLVLDNLNTHNSSAFYENLPANEALALSRRFEFYYTPKSASWLNMIEIEFSALARRCLNRRIPSMEILKREVMTLITERERKEIKINWQFSVEAARNKLNSHYVIVNDKNKVFQEQKT